MYLADALDADPGQLGVPAEGPVLGRDQQLPLPADRAALQVTRLVGDADVIS